MNEKELIALAKEQLERVVDVQVLADSDIKRIIKKYFTEILMVSLAYDNLGKSFKFSLSKELQEKVDNLIEQMRSEIFNVILQRCIDMSELFDEYYDYEEKEENIISFLLGDINGETLPDRIIEYTDNITKEFETYIAIGIGSDLSTAKISTEYISNIKHPYKSDLFKEAIMDSGYEADRIKSKGISFGAGKVVAAYYGLKRLEQDTIFKSYNNTLFSLWRNDSNIIGWFTLRGSNFDCPKLCDPMVRVFHPISETYFGWHTGCVCIPIPVHKSEL